MTIDELVEEAWNNAVTLGWADKPIDLPEMIALIHSEASEALEEFRDGKPLSYNGPDGKPEGVGPEFADILIRVAHYSHKLGIDLQREIVRKLAYNLTRGYRHGGKAI